MVFKRPGNGRDDQSGRSSNRPSKGGDNSKKSFSTSRGKSAPNSDRSGSRPSKKYNNESPGEKKPYSSDSKPYGSRSGDEKKSYSSDSKPYANRTGGDDNKQRSSFSGGDKKSFAPKRPYSGRPADSEAPKRSFGDSGGDKKSFTPRNKPYSGRVTSDDRPPKSPDSYRGGSGSSDDKKSFAPRSKSYSGRATSDDRPPKSPDSYRGSKESSGEKKSFAPRSKSYSGRATSDDRPPKSFSKESSGERKFAGAKSSERSGEKKFSPRATPDTGFKKREGGFKREDDATEKPYRKPAYDKITKDRDAPAKTMRPKKPSTKDDGLIRLNRYIANAGICSRRKADELILAGVVAVNGIVVAELGAKVDPMKDEIRYNGETLKREKMVYVLLNKPKDYITTTEDPQERRTVMHLVEKASRERIYPIGRLDRNTTGLLLMTNDGDLADKLSHPRSQITKLYQVELSKSLAQGDLNKIQFGVELEDGLIKPDSVSYVAGASKREIGIQIHSGKNRVVRRIFEHLGYEVVKLDRVVYAGLTKKDLPRGRWRFLDEKEVIQLKHLIK
jgi:23S rRNA pseudouridine2605 synthase